MKLIKNLMVAGAMIIIGACDPIEDRDVLKNSFNPDDIELEVIQTAGGKGNGLTLKMNTPGVSGWWDYKINKTNSDVVELVYPIPGTHTFTFTVSTPYITGGNPSNREVIVKTIDVTIEELDQPLPQPYYNLIGENLEGKTWVFDKGGAWWYMSNPNGNAYELWWPAWECCATADNIGKMVFDLDGGANYTYYADANGAPGGTGTFTFNGSFDRLTIGGGVNILGVGGDCARSPSSLAGEFKIIKLTADELILYVSDGPCNAPGTTTGWTWKFVPQAI